MTTTSRAFALALVAAAAALAGCAQPGLLEPVEPASQTASAPADAARPEPPEAARAAREPRPVGAEAGRIEVSNEIVVAESRLTVAPDDAPARGVPGAPVELADPPARAGTALVADHWALAVTVREASPDRVAAGEFEVRLEWDGEDAGRVRVAQSEAVADAAEAAVVLFDLGAAIDASSAYLVTVVAVASGPEPIRFALESTRSGDLTWTGLDAHAGIVNPTLEVPIGSALTLRVVNSDGLFHHLVIVDADSEAVAGPTPDLAEAGEEATLEWLAYGSGVFEYVCRYHEATMRGRVVVG